MTSRNGRRGTRRPAARTTRPGRSRTSRRPALHEPGEERTPTPDRAARARSPRPSRDRLRRHARPRRRGPGPSSCASDSASSTSTSQPFAPCSTSSLRLPDAGRDERDAGRHRLEHRLRPALLPRRRRGRRRARGTPARARRGSSPSTCAVRDRRAARARGERSPRAGPVSRTWSSGTSARIRSSAATSTSGPLIELRLEPFAPADAVLLERADDERVSREPERRARGGAPLGVDEREVLEVDPDRDRVDALGLDAGREHELAHLGVRHLDRARTGPAPPQRLERASNSG